MNSPHELLVDDGIRIAESLLTPGTPLDWTSSPARANQFGLTTDWDRNVVDESKVVALREVSLANYSLAKDKFKTIYDFYITIEDKNGNKFQEIGRAPSGRASQQINVERIVLYRNSTAKLRVQLWSTAV
ncbi:hypothetical protein HY570_02965 [Candidatus Micrarchaeota archaeon]|nr:hypothetical protein [Candidatus Micrarchaeota archaeon]